MNKVEQQKEQDAQQSGKPGSSDTSGSGSDSSSSGGGSGSGSSTGGPGNGGSTGGNTDNDANSGGLSAAEEESIHSWLVTKYNMLDGYVSRANDVVSTYNSTGSQAVRQPGRGDVCHSSRVRSSDILAPVKVVSAVCQSVGLLYQPMSMGRPLRR